MLLYLFEDARAYVLRADHDVVIKASGLAAGKGVIIPSSKDEALEALRDIMVSRRFGDSGETVVIEELMIGERPVPSHFVMVNVRFYACLSDHKRIRDGDEGPNTEAWVRTACAVITPQLSATICESILQPAVDGMAAEGFPFSGVLYAGIMVTKDGPKVVEFNCRFGDPETQVILPLLESDLLEICLACDVPGGLRGKEIRWAPSYAATVAGISKIPR